ncbi:MAG: hypothetical protein JWO58_811 [Chitinophagaceae bacterium]|nr:hypothetical protein [Chitinophagaceae bacterium]
MNKIINTFFAFLLLALPMVAQAQEVEMADQFRADGKIYVVITVFAIILTGLFVYVFLLDRKIGKLEKEEKN